ncbi:MAG: hypothetical protein ACOYMI_06045 [Phycisphaerales bacterium]|jgi:hypothetical protein
MLSAALAAVIVGNATAQTLHSNGPIITNPTGGTGSITGLPISNCDGFTVPGSTFNFSTTGVAATVATTTALADDFEVPESGWDLDALTIYAFQTSQTTASVTQVHVNLWTETPYSAGSPDEPATLPQPVLAANLVLPAGPGTFVCHRQSVTSTGTVRPVFSYTVSLDGLPNAGRLAPGRYWIQWSCAGAASPSANVFCPLVSPRAAVQGHNARQFNALDGNPASPRVWFEGREGYVAGSSEGRAFALPFELLGTVPPPCPSDLDGDRDVSASDIALALLDFGPCTDCASDVDGSGEVDGGDIAFLLLDFGSCP